MWCLCLGVGRIVFFFKCTATTEIYTYRHTLSLHGALPISRVLAEDRSLRGRMVLATKGGIVIGTPYDSSAAYVSKAIDASLRRLGVEHVDLWQVHRPDLLTHPAELARALEAAHEIGRASGRERGCQSVSIPVVAGTLKK